MADIFDVITATVSSAVATSGTITFAYPTGEAAASYDSNTKARLWSEGLEHLFTENTGEFSISYGGSNITVTYLGSTSIPAGTTVRLQAPKGTYADVAQAGGSYTQAEVNAIVDRVNALTAVLKDRGIIPVADRN